MSLFSFLMAAYAPSFASAGCLSTLLIYFRAVAEECQECVQTVANVGMLISLT